MRACRTVGDAKYFAAEGLLRLRRTAGWEGVGVPEQLVPHFDRREVFYKAGNKFHPQSYPGPIAATANGPTPPMDDGTHENPFDLPRESLLS